MDSEKSSGTTDFRLGQLDLPSSGPFSIFAQFVIKADKVAEVMVILEENARLCDNEPGTLAFHIAHKGNIFYVWEKYAYADALKYHAKVNTGMHKMMAKAEEVFESLPDIHVLEPI